MKKYFFKKSFIWIFIIMVMIPFVIGLLPSSLIPITTIFRLNIDAPKISAIITRVTTPICIFLYIYSGKFFANYLKNNSEYKGDFNKYQYIYYPLLITSTFLISTAEDFFNEIIFALDIEKITQNGIIGDVFAKSILTFAVSLIVGIAAIIIGSKCVSTLLCAVAECEEAEKNYFSKAFLPLTVSLLIAVVLDIIAVIFLKLSAVFFIRELVYVILLVSILLGLKYRFDDRKIKNLICKVLPFAYFLICVVFTVISLIRII